ncbi:MAG: hypothetical protein MUP55_02125 [Candidatus Aenigmarchaeota archaeon]|nr:hypothetical protein [Candidatus Aenigmarchaeota archaeon]
MGEDDTLEWEKQVNGYARLKKELKEPDGSQKEPAEPVPASHLGVVMHALLIKRLTELEREANPRSGIIRFPAVFEKLCRNFSINKKEAWEILFHLNELKIIRIVPYQGIVINDQKNTG